MKPAGAAEATSAVRPDSKDYPWLQEVRTPDGEGHVSNLQIAEIMYTAWRSYVAQAFGIDEQELYARPVRPIVREISVRFHVEVMPGEVLLCGVRTVSRSSRAFTLEQVLWRGDVLAAVGQTVLVTIDVASRTASPIPPEFWAAIEGFERRPIAPTR